MYRNISLVVLFFTSICFIQSCQIDNDCLNGSGKRRQLEKSLNEFAHLTILSSIDVKLVADSINKAIISGDNNLLDRVELTIENETLFVNFASRACIKTSHNMQVELHYKSLQGIAIQGSGDVSGKDGLSGEAMRINIQGSGDVDVNIEGGKLNLEINGSGDVALNGKVNESNIDISGSGNINMYDCKADTSRVHIGGSGDSKLHVNDALYVWVNGSGDVYYRGDAKLIVEENNGSGDVLKRP